MNYWQIKNILKNKDCLNPERNINYSYNRTKFHNRYESFEHFMAKAMLTFLLFKKGKGIISEAEMRDGRVIDILQINKKGELVGYELNNTKPDKIDVHNVDIADIPLDQMPETAKQGIRDLGKWLEQYII